MSESAASKTDPFHLRSLETSMFQNTNPLNLYIISYFTETETSELYFSYTLKSTHMQVHHQSFTAENHVKPLKPHL